ncbi:hypothetical protein M3P05_14050 [Sansalvadorimonas sp. 2012CJ34-2]|uniref:PepSY domain-containing protein n=1 Tax=Parendozoicomonas callyspongiae TaxID=2942213 RepID=A0ABT0PI70_9GAMM|nr:hypothetical protein [Sansalvadorimonas sp. 2012CJ34-2]MCL6271050.1 hypothetical protein [Sansalvadorimonas sp. 2012CJ34-2]
MHRLHTPLLALSGLLLITQPALSESQNPLKNAPASKSSSTNLPLEKIISIAREKNPTMRIINTFKEQMGGKEVDRVFYFLPDKKEARVMTLDPVTGTVMDDHAYKIPEKQQTIPLETLLSNLRTKYSIVKVIRTRTAQRDGRDVRIILYVDKLKQQRTMVVDTKTGEVISDNARKLSG